MTKFEIWYPLKPYWINQRFGESTQCLDATNKVVPKINGSCPIGTRDLYTSMGLLGHNGEDLMASDNQNVYCSQDGIIVEVQTEPERGLGIGIITNQKYDLGEYGEHFVKCRYWHLKGFNCKLGDKISVGQVIGYADNTGYSSGTHLHFEIKPIEYDTSGNYFNVFQDNGYYGSINPDLYWNKVYSQDIWIFTKIIEIYKLIINKLTNK